ncbi:MAG: flagellar biosynthesis repressor FlbT [Pseudomonadota bacterium]
MPLKLSLKPGETFVVNGAVVRNGERRGVLLLETQARVLRDKDIMLPEEANSPAREAYFAVMQLYLTGEDSGPRYDAAIDSLAQVLTDDSLNDEEREGVLAVSRAMASGDLYRALGASRKLIAAETARAA